MALLERPDGVSIHWEERGEGPLVVFANSFLGWREVFRDMLEDLERDHRVVTYDMRGNGASTRRGPYDFETDVADLEALVEETGPPAVAIAMADGCNRAVKLAARRPDLITAVLTPGGNPAGRTAVMDTEGLAASDSVIEAIVEQFERDFRGALRTTAGTANPQLDEDGVRRRVEDAVAYTPQEAVVARLREWIDDDSSEEGRTMGGRLWILHHGNNPWFPMEVANRTRELLPEAHVEEVPDGPLSRPDLTAAAVRLVTADARVASA